MSEEHGPVSPREILNKVWSWPVISFVLAALLGFEVSFMTSGHPWMADLFLLVSAALFLAKFLTWEDARQQASAIRRRLSIYAILITATVTLAAILGTHYLNRPRETVQLKADARSLPIPQESENNKPNERIELKQPSEELATIQLNCERVLRPVEWDNDTLYVLETYPTLTEGLVELTSNTGKPRFWPENYKPENRLYRCDLANYGTAAVFGLSMKFNLTFIEAQKVPDGPKARKGGATLSTHNHVINLPVLNGNGGRFIFYLNNQSEYFVNVGLPEFADLEIAGQKERQIVRFKPTSPNWPRTFFLSPKTE